jgi:hypothetical protein
MGLVKRSFFVAAVALCALVGFAPQASAFVHWSNADGTASFFDWSDGGSDHGMFGDPTLIGGDTFMFTPEDFRAESADGMPDAAHDRLQVDLTAHSGQSFTSIMITEGGDYGMFGPDDNGAGAVVAMGAGFVLNRMGGPTAMDAFISGPYVDEDGLTQGFWDGGVTIDLMAQNNDEPLTDLRLVFNNNLLAISHVGTISFIQKKTFFITFTPEPASALLLASGGGLLLLRRRRRTA